MCPTLKKYDDYDKTLILEYKWIPWDETSIETFLSASRRLH